MAARSILVSMSTRSVGHYLHKKSLGEFRLWSASILYCRRSGPCCILDSNSHTEVSLMNNPIIRMSQFKLYGQIYVKCWYSRVWAIIYLWPAQAQHSRKNHVFQALECRKPLEFSQQCKLGNIVLYATFSPPQFNVRTVALVSSRPQFALPIRMERPQRPLFAWSWARAEVTTATDMREEV